MSRVQKFTNLGNKNLISGDPTGRPELTYGAYVPVGVGYTGEGGVNVGGACTAGAGFVGNLTGNVTGNVTGNCSKW